MLSSSRNGISRAGWQGASNVTVFSLICHKLFCTSLLKPKKSEAALLQSCWIASFSIHTCPLFFWYKFEHFAQHKVGNAYYFLFVSFHAMHPWTTKLLAGQEYGAEKFAPHPVSIVMYLRDLMNTVTAPSKGNFTNATCRSHHVSLIFGPKTTCIPRVVVDCWPQWRFCMHLCTVWLYSFFTCPDYIR